MSHRKQRKEKVCLNCNAHVEANYCSICGQENVETRETAWQLIVHFFEDITHFDGKFFSTTKYLITKPGFLSAEYKRGRRASYLNPVRMYIFTSFAFFFAFFSLVNLDPTTVSFKYGNYKIADIEKMDSTEFAQRIGKINDTITKEDIIAMAKESGIRRRQSDYKSKADYTRALATDTLNDNWLERKLEYRMIELDKKFAGKPGSMQKQLLEFLLHTFPQLLFTSLPLFAFWLHLLYMRRKKFNYVDNGIFTIHLYIFILFISFILLLLSEFQSYFNIPYLNILKPLLLLGIVLYAYKAMRTFYGQRRAKTILKFFLTFFGFVVIFIFLLLIFLGYSFYKV